MLLENKLRLFDDQLKRNQDYSSQLQKDLGDSIKARKDLQARMESFDKTKERELHEIKMQYQTEILSLQDQLRSLTMQLDTKIGAKEQEIEYHQKSLQMKKVKF